MSDSIGSHVSTANNYAQALLTRRWSASRHNRFMPTKTKEAPVLDDPVLGTGLRAMGDRLRVAMEAKGIENATVADYCGVSESAVRQWQGGFQPLKMPNLIGAAEVIGESIDWLVLGGGNMDSIDAKVRRVPEVMRTALITEIHQLIEKKQHEAKRLPAEMLGGNLINDADVRLKAWSAKGKPKTPRPKRKKP